MLWSVAKLGDTKTPSMPFWRSQYTGGVPASGAIFSPSGETSQTGPIFSVTSIRPSGKKAIRQGSPKVAGVVILKGRVASGFCSPTLTWVQPATGARVRNSAALASFIIVLLASFLKDAVHYTSQWPRDSCYSRRSRAEHLT